MSYQSSDIFTEMFDLVFIGKDLLELGQVLPHNLWIFDNGTRMAKLPIRFLTIVPHFYTKIAKLKLKEKVSMNSKNSDTPLIIENNLNDVRFLKENLAKSSQQHFQVISYPVRTPNANG